MFSYNHNFLFARQQLTSHRGHYTLLQAVRDGLYPMSNLGLSAGRPCLIHVGLHVASYEKPATVKSDKEGQLVSP
jgi:hypothetical protein